MGILKPFSTYFYNKCRTFIAYVLCFSLLFSQTAWAFDAIVPPKNITDNPINHIVVDPGSGATHLDRAQNGTPVININAASNGGVSANYYRDFNVNNENLIFNNLKGEAANSHLGGSLHGNPNFNVPGGRAADIILNEVTTNRISNLNGYVEVFGKRADLIIANPNGIMVSGAGFINTGRLSLVTGRSTGLDGNGNLTPFSISTNPDAIITVVGRNVFDDDGRAVAYNLGIDANGSNYVDLISRVVKINGNIYAGNGINIQTGNDRAVRDANGWNVTSTNKSGAPEFAIDSTAMGGMYAGRVAIIATENGVGVRTRGDLIASVDDINFDVNGNVKLESTGSLQAKKNININAREINNGGKIVAENNVNIAAQKVTSNDEIYAKNKITINANELNNNSKISTTNGAIELNVGATNNAGEIASGGALTRPKASSRARPARSRSFRAASSWAP